MGTESRQGGLVVAGCDGSWQSQAAVAAATVEAARRHARLVLLAVPGERQFTPCGLSGGARREGEAMQIARAALRAARTVVTKTDPEVPCEMASPSLDSPELAGVAAAADLLVLGGHGRRGQAAFSLGSPSAELLRRFAVPILLPCLRETPERSIVAGHRAGVVVGLKGRDDDVAVLAAAVAEAAVRACGVVVVHAVTPGGGPDHDLVTVAEQRVWDTVRRVDHSADLPLRVVTSVDDPVTALADQCGPGDLLVVGNHGGGRLAGLVPGSVARALLDAMPCDVLVAPVGSPVRPPYAAAPAPSGASAGALPTQG